MGDTVKVTNFTPGPTPLPDLVLQTMAEPILSHRSSDFSQLMTRIVKGLKYVFQTKQTVLPLTASGSGAMEAAVVNLFSAGDRVLAIRSGKFGNRWVELCQTFGLNTEVFDVEWGQSVDPQEVRTFIDKHGPFKGMFATDSETSTGALHDVKSLGEIARESECYFIVDAVSGLCANKFQTDDWFVDLALTGSQKGLMVPPGLSFIAVSEAAWQAIEKNNHPSYYFNLLKARKALEKGLTPYTPAVSLLMGLSGALQIIEEMGLSKIRTIHEINAQTTRAGVSALGLKLFAHTPSNVLTAVIMPDAIDGTAVLKTIKNDCGVMIANGMDHYKGKVIRISHLGYDIVPSDMLFALSALEYGLAQHGHKFSTGTGVSAAQKLILENAKRRI